MVLFVAWTWSSFSRRTFFRLSRLSTRSMWTQPVLLARRLKVREYLALILGPFETSSGETLLPDMVPNTFPGESSIAPPIPNENLRGATSTSPTTSEQPPAAVVSLSGPSAPVPEVTEVPIPRKVWAFPFPAFFCSRTPFPCFLLLTDSLMLSSHRGEHHKTLRRHHPDLPTLQRSWLQLRLPSYRLHPSRAMPLFRVLSCPPYAYTPLFSSNPGTSRDLPHSLSLKRANSRRPDEQIRASNPLPL